MATSSLNLRIRNVFLRYILNIWTVYCYLLSIAFCCGFVPHLTTPEYSRRIDSVKSLVETNHFWGVDFPLDLNLTLNLRVSKYISLFFIFIQILNLVHSYVLMFSIQKLIKEKPRLILALCHDRRKSTTSCMNLHILNFIIKKLARLAGKL